MLRAPARRQPDADSEIVYIGSSFKKIWVPEGAKPLPAQGVSRYSTDVCPASQRAVYIGSSGLGRTWYLW